MNFKKYISVILCLLSVQLLFPERTYSEVTDSSKPPQIKASAACLMEVATGQIHFEKEGDKRREPASLTKVMTSIVAIEKGNLKDVVTVPQRAARVSMGQDIGLNTGDKLYLEDLLKAALLYSANDSTVAIGEHIGGNHDQFIKMMNDQAAALGMKNTSLANTNGFHHPNHYTTANDLATLTCYALKNKTFAEFVRTKEATITWLPKVTDTTTTEDEEKTPPKQRTLRSTNRLLHSDFEGIDGVKTGTTPRAGNCLIASATREGRQLVVVILNSNNRWNDATRLLEYGFNEVERRVLIEKDEVVSEIQVLEGVETRVALVTANRVEAYVASMDSDKIESRITRNPIPRAPIKQGDKLGKMVFVLNDKEIGTVDLIANQHIERLAWYKRIFD
ncbi:D-alanyl-D-alanine carboxypeptidase family protein [Desulfotomaculum sp. 1211_IL3151]|uniref:D-alanyl-D-alanine carboxypeptidase family protein n=1 Tax=Desulfotomaculum sp. 1211_IL3151 TaxID=3084055 RepID=UPI002FD92F90